MEVSRQLVWDWATRCSMVLVGLALDFEVFAFFCFVKGLGYHAAFPQNNGAAIIQLFRDCLFCILALNIGQQLSEAFNLGVCRGFFVVGNKGELFNFPIYLSETFSPSCECVVQQSEVLQSQVSHHLIRDVVKHFNKHLLNRTCQRDRSTERD